jgi:heptaprenyl diphosphate synthase
VLLLRQANRPEDADLITALAGDLSSDAALSEALAELRANPAMQAAADVTREWADQARATLAGLPDTPARDALDSLCDFVANRHA